MDLVVTNLRGVQRAGGDLIGDQFALDISLGARAGLGVLEAVDLLAGLAAGVGVGERLAGPVGEAFEVGELAAGRLAVVVAIGGSWWWGAGMPRPGPRSIGAGLSSDWQRLLAVREALPSGPPIA